MHTFRFLFFFVTLLAAFSPAKLFAQDKATYLFVGTYTVGQPDDGIYVFRFHPKTGRLHVISHGQQLTNPSFLTLSPDGRNLYACTDTKLPEEGSVSAFAFDSISGQLTFLNKQPSGGENPVYLATDPSRKWLVNANYTSGSLSVFPLQEDGRIDPYVQLIPFTGSGPVNDRQEAAHIHATVFAPAANYLLLPDLGSDKIRVLAFDSVVTLPATSVDSLAAIAVPGSGPRHLAFHPNGHWTYCIEELGGTVAAYAYQNGHLDSIQRIRSYAKIQETYGSADIHVSPDGRFLYASNRWDGENTIAIFAIDPSSGRLTLAGHQPTFGDHPRNFTIDPSGRYLLVANLATNNIVVFRRDATTGLLKKLRREVPVMRPSCLQMREYGLQGTGK